MQEFLQQLINGLSVGAIYALVAVGYTMVYGILKLINFAHGEVFMVGAMVSLLLAKVLGWSGPTALLVCLLVAVVACGVLGFSIERLAYRPLRSRPRLTSLITAIGVSLLIQYGGQKLFGPTDRVFPGDIWPVLSETFTVGADAPPAGAPPGAEPTGGISIAYVDVAVIGLTLVLMVALTYIVLYTRMGLALRAVSHSFDTASLMGVNIDRVVSFTFVLGSALAAAGGLLYAVKYLTINPLSGLIPGLKAFVAAVLGGIGSIPGAVAGGILLGLVEVFVSYLPNGSQYRDGVAFVILIAILLVKPSGLFGRTVVEKV